MVRASSVSRVISNSLPPVAKTLYAWAIEQNHEVEILSYLWPDGYLVDLAAQVKKVVKIPVCAVGKLGDPVLANQVLEDGKADFIALGRTLLADPHWANKVKEGKIDDINCCTYCNNCWERMSTTTRKEKRLFCTVNPALFREKEYAIKKVSKPKRVMVIGGGIAGMQAAKVAPERVITGKAKTGDRVVVIGGRMVGMETALYLAEKGKKVSLLTLNRLGENGKKLEENIYRTLRDRMIKNGIQVFPSTPAVEIRPDGVFANDCGNIL